VRCRNRAVWRVIDVKGLTTVNYTMLIYQTPEQIAARTDAAKQNDFWAAFLPYAKSLFDSGIVVGSAGLQGPESATTINLSNGKRLVQDGPYADTKEQLGGLFIIDVPDLDTALDWAKRCPAGVGERIEIRPNLPNLG
jgi:hypothetical protein